MRQIAADESAAACNHYGTFASGRRGITAAQPGGILYCFGPALREQTEQQFLRTIAPAQTEMMFAFIAVELVLTQELLHAEIVRAVPINAFRWCVHRINERRDLAALIVSPCRVAGLSDPDLGLAAVVQQHF